METGTDLIISTSSSEFKMEMEANETDGKRAKKALQGRRASQQSPPQELLIYYRQLPLI